MAGSGSDTIKDRKRAAESAAKMVLAKHPSVVAGSVLPVEVQAEPAPSRPIDVGESNIGRALQR